MYKTVGQCGDGGQRLEKKGRGHSMLEESSEVNQMAVVGLLMLLIIMTMILIMKCSVYKALKSKDIAL